MSVLTALDGTYNFRDLGGLALTNGGATRKGVFFRSDALGALTETGRRQLGDSDIEVIVDFRTPQERNAAPSGLPPQREIRMIELPLLQGDMSRLAGEAVASAAAGPTAANRAVIEQARAAIPTLADLYRGILTAGSASFAEVARLLGSLSQPDGLLIHCTAGKDRTGVCAAVILDSVGVERAAIIEDYTRTEGNLAGPWLDGMADMVASLGIPMTPDLHELIGGSPASVMEASLTWLDEQGGSAAYLASGGLTKAEQAGLCELLTDPR